MQIKKITIMSRGYAIQTENPPVGIFLVAEYDVVQDSFWNTQVEGDVVIKLHATRADAHLLFT